MDTTDKTQANAAPAQAVQKIEVQLASGVTRHYETAAQLREQIMSGAVAGADQARRIEQTGTETKPLGKPKTVQEFACANAELRDLYRPVWHTALRFAGYGALAGIALKALDTTVLAFHVDERLGVAWLVTLGCVLATGRWPLAIIGAIAIPIVFGVKANLFIAVLSMALVGVLFGAPAGLIVGTLVGHFKRTKAVRAPDAGPEGSRPYWLGLALPAAFLVAWTVAYLWLMEEAVEWLGK